MTPLKRYKSEAVRKQVSETNIQRANSLSHVLGWTQTIDATIEDKQVSPLDTYSVDANRRLTELDERQELFDENELVECLPSPLNVGVATQVPSSNLDTNLQRSDTVLYSPSNVNGTDIPRITAVSPLTEGTILSPIGSPFSSQNTLHPVQLLSSGILDPLRSGTRSSRGPVFIQSQELEEEQEDDDVTYSFDAGEIELVRTRKREPEIEQSDSCKYPVSSSSSSSSKASNTGQLAKRSERKSWVIFALFFFIILLIGGFVPAIVILSRGSALSVMSFFKNSDPYHRSTMLNQLHQMYPNNFQNTSSLGSSYKPVKRVSSDSLVHVQLEGSSLGHSNTFEGISSEYQNDSEVRVLMLNEKLPASGPVFYGLAYSPRSAIEPDCGITKRETLLDMALLSRVTTRIRNYGMQCKQSEYILDAIQELNLNMTLAMGIWIGPSESVNKMQMDEFKSVLKEYPRHLFEEIFIGNEVLFREDQSADRLAEYIHEAKNFVKSLGYFDLPVGTSEIGSLVSGGRNMGVVDASDVVGVNVHPFFGGVSADQGTHWTYSFMSSQVDSSDSTGTKYAITEIGWPYGGGKYQSASADSRSFQTFLDDFVCEAYHNNYAWYYFEAFDEPWKRVFYEGNNKWETEWGVFTSDRKMKDGVSFPTCI